jgi:DNA polymerase-3 subunit gamma/tau
MSQAFYRKWRPQTWDAVVGQEHVVQTLRNALAAGRVAHAYLFAGPRGTGKTSAARLLAKAVNCLAETLSDRPCGHCAHCQAVNEGRFLDLIEIDAASNTSVEDVRDLRDKINFSPNLGRYKVYIIDEVHMLSTAAFNALLKTLEEPPRHAIFILATTEVHKIPATVLSRCQRHEFRRIPVAKIVEYLKKQAQPEGIQVAEDALTLISRQSTGSLRDAISLFDQLASTGQAITLEMAQDVLGTAASQAVLDLVSALASGQPAAGLDAIHATLDAGSDPRQFARQIVDYVRSLLLIQSGNSESVDATAEVRAQMARHASHFSRPELLRALRLFNEVAVETRPVWQPALPLELAYLQALEPLETASDSGLPGQVPPLPNPSQKASLNAREKSKAPGGSSPARAGSVQETQSQGEEPPEPVADGSSAGAGGGAPPTLRGAAPANANDQLFHSVCENWRQVVQQVGLVSKQTQALLNSCKPYGVKDGVLFLGFNGDFAKSKMEKGDNVQVTCQALSQLIGKEVPVRCFIASGGKGTLPPEVESDGMVATALSDLGAEVVDIQ